MRIQYVITAAITAAILTAPASRVDADTGDFVAGAIVGGVVGAIAGNHNRRATTQRRTYVAKKRTYRPSIPSTQEGREIQSSLNYFGFNAGGVDGQLGRKSRNAISAYQAYLGYPATGQLTPFEQNLLISSHNRAQAGGYATQQLIAANPEGTRGLLKQFRQEMAGGQGTTLVTGPVASPQPAFPQTTVVVAPAAPQAVAPAPQAAAAAPSTTTTTTTTITALSAKAEADDKALPNLFGGDTQAQASLASHCNKVSLLTSTNGGFTTAASMTDASFAMSEQFCLARTYAISSGEELAGQLNATADQVNAHCGAYGDQMASHVQALSVKEADAVIRDVSGFVLASGIPTQDLSATAKVCLSVGYRTDNMDMAIGSGLILATLGEKAYGELMGHHLSQGFGASKRTDLSLPWYEMGMEATPVFNPGQPERNDLIRKAAYQIGGVDGAALGVEAETVPQEASLPTFQISQ